MFKKVLLGIAAVFFITTSVYGLRFLPHKQNQNVVKRNQKNYRSKVVRKVDREKIELKVTNSTNKSFRLKKMVR